MTCSKTRHWLQWQLLALVVLVYGISFFLPAVSIPGRMGEMSEQPHPQVLLQSLDLMADRGWGHMQLIRRIREA